MIKNLQLQRRLSAYSAVAGAMLAGASNANAQVMYTDIPDTTLLVGDLYEMDLNNDGTVDFTFDVGANANSTWYKVEVLASSTANQAIGYIGSLGYYYPDKLNAGDYIGSGGNFVPVYPWATFIILYTTGNAYGDWQGGVTNGFVGLKFLANGNIFYGWARLDINETSTVAVIKDFAYNATPDAGLNAGEIPAGMNEVSAVAPKIYAENRNLQVQFKANSHLEIRNSAGIVLKELSLSNDRSVIDLSSLSAGSYIATIKSDGKQWSLKIVLQ